MQPDRKTYLGSGDIAAVAGVSPYSSSLDVWAQKTGLVPDKEATPAMNVGNVLERAIVEGLYAEPRGLVVDFPGWQQHPGIPHYGATVDALAQPAELAERRMGTTAGTDTRIVECKVVGTHMQKRWGDEDQAGADAVPPDVLVQVQWQFLCTGQQIADVVALLGTDFRVYRVERDNEMIANLQTIGERFWELVQTKTAPEITAETASSARDLINRLYPRQTLDLAEFTTPERKLAELYMEQRDAVKAAKKEQDATAALLCSSIGERTGLLAADLKATWKAGEKGSTKWKDVAMSMEPSEFLIAEHTGEPSRKLDVRRVKPRH